MNKNYLVLVGLPMALVVVFFLGFLVGNRSKAKPVSSKSEEAKKVQASLPTQPLILSEDEKKILSPIASNAAEAEKKERSLLALSLSKRSTFLEINECQPQPVVLELTKGTDFMIRNSSSHFHRVTFDKSHTYALHPGEQTTVKADFAQSLRRYACDFEISGYLNIIQ